MFTHRLLAEGFREDEVRPLVDPHLAVVVEKLYQLFFI